MILLKADKVLSWLQAINKDQKWLALELHVGKSYISQIIHNRCKISRPVMEHLMTLTHMDFQTLFYTDTGEDDRVFYGVDIFFRGVMMKSEQYNSEVKKILEQK